LEITNLIAYIKSMLTRFFKILNNIKSYTLLDILTLNVDHKINNIRFI
jgi:hypothetical protein